MSSSVWSIPALADRVLAVAMTSTTATPAVPHRPDPASVLRAIDKRSYLTLSTVSAAGHPHAAGVLYERVGDTLYVNTTATSRKARNITSSGRAAVVIPVRRMPVGAPPSGLQFQARAEVLPVDDRRILDLAEGGALRSITGHGELELPGSCFLAIRIPRRVLTYGLGMPLLELARDPLGAAGAVELDW